MHDDRMESLTALAFDSYVEIGIVGAARLSVPPHVIAERLRSLRQLAPTDRESEVQRGYEPWSYFWGKYKGEEDLWWDYERLDEEWYVDDKRHPDGEFEFRTAEEEAVPAEVSSRAEADTSTAPELPTPNILELRTHSGQHGLSRAWEFHKGDPDPYPAVPHGHELRDKLVQNWPKLDPYRGFVYDASGARLRREPRHAIVALWNNPKFRTFAYDALRHALDNDPTLERRMLDERGIRNPLRLPGERG